MAFAYRVRRIGSFVLVPVPNEGKSSSRCHRATQRKFEWQTNQQVTARASAYIAPPCLFQVATDFYIVCGESVSSGHF